MSVSHFNQRFQVEHQTNNRVLVVDDDPLILELYRNSFTTGDQLQSEFLHLFPGQERAGEFTFQLTTAAQGEEAVELVRQSLERGEPYAVLFLDERMPPGINGREAARQIRELDSNIHIVIASAYTDYLPSEYRRVTFSHLYLLRKPFNTAEVEHMAYNACLGWNRDRQLQAELNNNVAYRLWLNRLFDSLPVPVVVIDIDSKQVLMNGGPIHTAHDATRCHQQLFAQDHPCESEQGGCPLQQVIELGEKVVQQHRSVDSQGEVTVFELHVVPIQNERGETYQVLEFAIDITDQQQRLKEKETQVRQQKQLFDTFRSTAHTMKNSIGYLKGVTERLIRIDERSGPMGELLNEERVGLISDQIEMINTMLQLALGTARHSASQETKLSLQDKVHEVLSLFAISSRGKGKGVDLQMDEGVQSCICMSPIDCQTLLLNLLNNAADAVDAYMKQKLESGDPDDLEQLLVLQDAPMITVRVEAAESQLQIDISNRGEPISPHLQQRIFQQGVSMREEGNGVGLYDVQQILHQAGGHIELHNGDEEVCFRVLLPRVLCDTSESNGSVSL